MPLTTLACTAIDQIAVDPSVARKIILSYLPTDSALFFTTDEDRVLLNKQRQHLQPIIRWMNRTFHFEFETTQEMSKRLPHSEQTVAKLERMVEQLVSIHL